MHVKKATTRAAWLFAAAAAVALAGPARAHVDVDGDLTDLKDQAQGDQSDRLFDVTDAFVSGWDFTHVWIFYNPKRDTLYVGLELQENGEFPGVPGDADGDRDPSVTSRLDVPEDQHGVGLDETYTIGIDGDLDGDFEGPNDFLFIYRNNEVSFARGDGGPMPESLTGEIILGTAGAIDTNGMPHTNPDTDGVEIAIANFSLAFATNSPGVDPCEFGLTVYAGSLVDALDEDQLDSPLFFTFPQNVTFEDEITAGGSGGINCRTVTVGEVITITATLANTSADTLTPVWINHHLPAGLEYVSGSVANAVEGKNVPLAGGRLVRHLAPGFDVSLSPGETEVVTFQVRVTSALPEPTFIRGYAEGVLGGGPACVFSCIDVVCVTTATGG
jgi:uncharacterized repeat protein (TIGR01451 family)